MKCPINNKECNNVAVKVTSLFSGSEIICCNSCLSEVVGDTLDNNTSSLHLDLFLGPEKPTKSICDRCGSSIDDIKKARQIGCPRCYDFFGDLILPFVYLNQFGASSHRGKIPIRSGKRDLHKELADAIAAENYERAAEIKLLIERDKA